MEDFDVGDPVGSREADFAAGSPELLLADSLQSTQKLAANSHESA